MSKTDQLLAQKFHCQKCDHTGGRVDRLAMSGTGLSRLLEIQAHRYAFVSCNNCGFTEVFNLRTLEGKDNLGTFLDVLFMD
jgi:predicted nucleic-acid-binding Zn-ribbon protein